MCGDAHICSDVDEYYHPPPQTGSTHLVMQYEYIGWTAEKMTDVSGFVQFVFDVARRIDEGNYTNNAILVHDT